MSDFGKQMIFKKLWDEHRKVEIPLIQRDYAQGRESAADVRDEFLKALKYALGLPFDDPSLPLNLDFIYGSVEGDKESSFLPLDGQQRLTTLFLLHWYAAWQDECLKEFRAWMTSETESCFSYSVRPSSEEFFDRLMAFDPESAPAETSSVSGLITDQSWYFRYWRLDPTIQAVLVMLDAIHKAFEGLDGLYSRLVDESNPAITFQLLNLKDFELTDDLYLKMNARGKPLTEFETFKARFEQELTNLFEGDETREIGGESFPIPEFFSRRMDTGWADFFWEHKDEETKLYDAAVMNFFRAVVLATRRPKSTSFHKDVPMIRNEYFSFSFSRIHEKGWLDKLFANSLIVLLEKWTGGSGEIVRQLPNSQYFDEEAFFDKIARNPTKLEYVEIVQFAAFLMLLTKHEEELDPDRFQEWMRVVFNLSVNTAYDRSTELGYSISGLLKLKKYSDDILAFLAGPEEFFVGFRRQQVEEERLKAALILADPGWRPLIGRAENHEYFRGQIEFLLDFCGVLDRWEESKLEGIGPGDHTDFQREFEKYLLRAEKMFTPHGLYNLGECRWERALLTFGDYLLRSGRQNDSFLVGAHTEPASWKRLLRGPAGTENHPRYFLKALWDALPLEGNLSDELDEVIAQADEVDGWRAALLKTPEAIEYCTKRLIRFFQGDHGPSAIYLMRTTTLRGKHAELYTYQLYSNILSKKGKDWFSPLVLNPYYSVSGLDEEPGIRISVRIEKKTAYFDIEWRRRSLVLFFDKSYNSEFEDLYDFLQEHTFMSRPLHERRARISSYGSADEIVTAIEDAKHAVVEFIESKKDDA